MIISATHPLGPGGATYLWEENTTGTWNTLPNSGVGITRVINETTKYRVTINYPNVSGASNCGPVTSPEFTVSIEDKPDPTIVSADTIHCPNGVSYFFNDTPRNGSSHEWSVQDPLVSEAILDNVFSVQWPDTPNASYTIEVTETVGELFANCNGTSSTTVTLSSGNSAPVPAEIFFSPINNTLIYNDSTINCYQWGYFDREIAGSVELEGEIYQSYVAGDLYDTTRVYWCRAQFDCDDICSTTALFKLVTQNEDNTPEEESPEQFVLYPNPNDGSFRLEANRLLENSPYQIRITNVLGQVVRQETVTTTGDELDIQIDINNSAGVYYMSLYREGKLKKVIPFVVLQR